MIMLLNIIVINEESIEFFVYWLCNLQAFLLLTCWFSIGMISKESIWNHSKNTTLTSAWS